MPLSDEDDDDDYAHFTADSEDPAKGHSRQGSAEDGHLYAGHHSTAGFSLPLLQILLLHRNKQDTLVSVLQEAVQCSILIVKLGESNICKYRARSI